MAFSPRDALDAARAILDGPAVKEERRLERIAAACRPDWDAHRFVPPGTPPIARELARRSRTNYLPLILGSLVQSLHVDGYRPATERDNAAPWAWWQANKMDARQTGVHNSALKFGVSYVVVTPGDPSPVIRGVSPRKMTALYRDDDAADDWPLMALERTGELTRLYDEESVYIFGGEFGALEYIETREHGMPMCPVVRFRDLMLLDDDEQVGVVEPLLTIQDQLDDTVYTGAVTEYFQAFRQRYVIGWVPADEEERLKASASELWTFADPDVKVGDFAATDSSGNIASKESKIRDMAAIAQVPPQQLALGSLSNMSAETLASLEAGKDRKVGDIETSLGESWEQVFNAAGEAAGDEAAASDMESEVHWRDSTARSLAQTVDALGKMVQMLGIPPEGVWPMVPGTTQGDLESWKALRAEGDTFAQLGALLDAQA